MRDRVLTVDKLGPQLNGGAGKPRIRPDTPADAVARFKDQNPLAAIMQATTSGQASSTVAVHTSV